MKKTLVALAAVAATSAFAQSSVSIYGLVDVNYNTQTTKNAAGATLYKTTGLGEGTTAGNRLGFRGTEDLGGGLKASFLVEVGLSVISTDTFGNRAGTSGHTDTTLNTGNNAGASSINPANSAFRAGGVDQNRQSYVGLSGNFGEVRIGYQYTNAYTVSSLSGYLGGYEGTAGSDLAHTLGFAPIGGARANGITYIAPAFGGGFNAQVQYGSNANPSMDGGAPGAEYQNKRTGFLVGYGNGPLKASLAYTRQNNQTAGGATTTAKLTQLGGSYNFGVASVTGLYNKGDNGAAAVVDYKSHQLGVKVPFGKATVFATVGRGKQTNAGLSTLATDAKQNQIGAEYTLSKRTMVYAVTGTTNNTSGTALSNKGTATRFGVRHTF